MMPTRPTLRLGLAAVLLPLLLAACGGLVKLPNSGPAPSLYNLTPVADIQAQGTEMRLRIEDPTAAGGLDTTMIARRSSPNELQFFAEARWSGRPTVMIQNVLVQSFENAGQAVTQARGGAVVPAAYELQVELRDFQAEYFNGASVPEVHVRFAVNLVGLNPLHAAGQRMVEARVSAGGGDMPSVIAAFDEAVHQALRETVSWSVGRLAAQP
jgi:cholesterol transport system auxiliary component